MKIRRVFDSIERKEILEKSQQCLWSETGKPALDYLCGQRQLSEQIVRSFQIGFVPHSVRHQLRGRVILPLFNPSGVLVAISARKIDDFESPLPPPYWHEGYEKSFYLYGIHNAIPSIRKWQFVNVVEGQFDVLQMHNHGITNAVGLCCHFLSAMQYAILNRYCEEIILIMDKDENNAGKKGVEKALNDMLSFGFDNYPTREYRHKLSFVEFSYNTDPDEFLREHGANELRSLIKPKLREIRKNFYDS